jgi:SAM-dependent methyltransferase
MEGSYPSKLRVWEGAAAVAAGDPALPQGRPVPGPHQPTGIAEKLFAIETWGPAAGRRDAGAEPYTLQWYLAIEDQRFNRRGRWLPRLLEFAKHGGETLLGLGQGLGTDWLQYARHGASVTVCCPSALQLGLIRRNFELRGLAGRFVHAPAESLPLPSASIDVACVNYVLAETAVSPEVVEEIYRVLKPGGKVLVVAPARYDIDFWSRAGFFWQRWLGPWKPRQNSGQSPGFTGRSLKRLFQRFVDHRIRKRQLRRSDVPHVWRWAPLPILERLMGRALVVRAFKPLSASLPTSAAA